MAWTCYKLVYQAISPIHIGYGRLGNIQLTRYYILGKNMWGTAVANLTKAIMQKKGKYELSLYGTIGNIFKEPLIFSYFYPAIDVNNPFIPFYKEDGLYYGLKSPILTKSEFEQDFISSLPSTAIDPSTFTIEEGSLHEVEFITPWTKKTKRPVYFVGYLFAKKGISEDYEIKFADNPPSILINDYELFNAFAQIYVGGEKRYGFGLLRLCFDKIEIIRNKIFDRYSVELQDNKFITIISKDLPIFAHLDVSDTEHINIEGNIEPLVGREWEDEVQRSHQGAGQRLSKGVICYTPGSVLKSKANACIERFGRLRLFTRLTEANNA